MNNNFKKACTSDNTNFDSTTSAYNPSEIYAGPKYKCGICGTIHDTIEDRAKCEMACLKKQEEEERLAAEKKKKEEQHKRKKEVDDAFKRAENLRNKYVEDYGYYSYENKYIVRNHKDENPYERFCDLLTLLP